MFRNKILAITLLLVLLLAIMAWGETANIEFKSVRALGMGGAGITTMNDFSALMYNPAQLGRCDFHLDIVNVQARLSNDVFEMIKFYDDNQAIFDDYANATVTEQNDLLDGLAKFDDKWIGAGAYPTVGVTFKNYAIGGYAVADVNFKADKGIFEPRVYMQGIGDIVISGGMAFDLSKFNILPGKLMGGASIRHITRYEVKRLQMAAGDVDLETALDTLIEDKKTGIGVDLGLLYEVIPEKLDIGLKVGDFMGKIGDEKPPMIINVGASYKMSKDLLLAADYNDFFFHRGENIFNKLYVGGEYSLGSILFLRGGFGQGYPSVGVGLNLKILVIDGAIYGMERTDAPGGEADYNYVVRFKLGI